MLIPFVLKHQFKIKDKIQPVLQRFKLRSCNPLIDEQSNLKYCYNTPEGIIQHRGSRHINR